MSCWCEISIEQEAVYSVLDIYEQPLLMLLLKTHEKTSNDLMEEAENNELIESYSARTIISWKDVDINTKSDEGKTVLMLAAANHNQYIVKKLIDLGADVMSVDKNGSTALHYAVSNSYDDISVLEELVRGGACVNATNYEGNKPIHTAVRSRILLLQSIG